MATSRVVANPFLTLAVAFISQLYAGTMYWFPAITPGISQALGFSKWQSTVIIAVANSGSLFGIIGGTFNQWYGSRITASFSAFGVALSYFLLGLVTKLYTGSSPTNALYIAVLFLAICIPTAGYPLYSCSIAASADIFPQRYRGRIVGLNALTYGGAAGVHASIQAILFPDASQTPANLIFVSACALVMAVVTFFVYPPVAKFDVDNIMIPTDSNEEQLPLQHKEASSDYSERASTSTPSTPSYDRYIALRLTVAYKIALFLVFSLQFNAFCDIISAPSSVRVIATACVMATVLSMLYLPASSSLRVYSTSEPVSDETNISESTTSPPTPAPEATSNPKDLSLWYCMTDVRGIYLEASMAILVGSGGMFLLVQSLYLVDALRYGPFQVWSNVDSNVAVRMIVALFTAFSVTGRITLGATIDRGDTPEQRIMLAFKLLRYNFLLMALAILTLAIPSKVAVLLAVVGVGFSYGAYFCSAPTLTTLWFGVSTFPRNFAVYGAFTSLAAISVNSSAAAWIRSHLGNWIDVPSADGGVSSVCAGFMCTLPVLVPSFALQLVMFVIGGILQPVVQRRAKPTYMLDVK